MATEVKLPELGENIEEGEVVSVMVAPGATVEVDQPLFELETGKATVEVPSMMAGVVEKVLVKEGDTVKVGQPMLTMAEGAAAPTGDAPAESPPHETGAEPPVPAETATPTAPPPSSPAPAMPPPEPAPGVPVAASPSVRKFAREIGLDVGRVPGTGSGGRITKNDVKTFAKQALQAGVPAAGPAAPAVTLPDFTAWGEVRREKMTTIRRLTARHMTQCWTTIPHVTQHGNADITRLEAFRKRFGQKAEKQGTKLTPTAVFVKMVTGALKAFPNLNASVDMANAEIVYKDYIHIGVAVDTPKGLVVPVIRDVDKKNVLTLADELNETAARAREGRIGPDELQGGTFTVSNLGGIGGTYFTPIVNHPEVAILGIGRAAKQAIWNGEGFEPRLVLPLSLSYDHRLVDGAEGARFLRWLIDAIEEPILLALEG